MLANLRVHRKHPRAGVGEGVAVVLGRGVVGWWREEDSVCVCVCVCVGVGQRSDGLSARKYSKLSLLFV